jgi:hypothetical protein
MIWVQPKSTQKLARSVNSYLEKMVLGIFNLNVCDTVAQQKMIST